MTSICQGCRGVGYTPARYRFSTGAVICVCDLHVCSGVGAYLSPVGVSIYTPTPLLGWPVVVA